VFIIDDQSNFKFDETPNLMIGIAVVVVVFVVREGVRL